MIDTTSLNENGFVYYNEQDYINGKFSSFSSPYITDLEFKSLKGDAVYSKNDLVAYLRVKYGNVELTEKQLADIGVISNMAFEHNMRIVSDIIIPETSHEHRLLGEEHFDDSTLFADKNKYEEIKEISFKFFNLTYVDELKKMLEKKMNELSEKSDCMKNELNESKRFKIAEFKRELKFPYNPQGDIIRKNRHENSITAQGCVLEIGNG